MTVSHFVQYVADLRHYFFFEHSEIIKFVLSV